MAAAGSAVGWNSQRRYEWLSEARAQAHKGKPVELLVRDLAVDRVRPARQPERHLSDAIVPACKARYDQELIEVLPDLETSDFIFVRDQTNA